MQSTRPDTAEKVLEDLRALVQDGEDLLRAGASDLGERGQELRDRLQATLEKARSTYARLEERTVRSLKAADHAIHEHPYQAIGLALGTGMLLGFLAARHRD